MPGGLSGASFFVMTVSRDFQPANCVTYSARLSDENSMGANKTYRQKGDRGRLLGESNEFKRLRRAVEKAHGDRDRAMAFVCRLCHMSSFEALPAAVRAATLALLGATAD
jgi:hypothetical protein